MPNTQDTQTQTSQTQDNAQQTQVQAPSQNNALQATTTTTQDAQWQAMSPTITLTPTTTPTQSSDQSSAQSSPQPDTAQTLTTQDTQENTQPQDASTSQATAPATSQTTQAPQPSPTPITPADTKPLKDALSELQNITATAPSVTTPATENTYPIDEKRMQELISFEEKLENALNASTSIKESTRLNLEGLSELYKISKDIYTFYELQASKLSTITTDAKSLRSEIIQITSYIATSLKSITDTTNTALDIYKQCDNALNQANNTYTRLDLRANELALTLEEINKLKDNVQEIRSLKTIFSELILKGEELKNQINSLVPNILAEVKAELLIDKEKHEEKLQEATTQHLQNINTAYTQTNQTIDEFKEYLRQKELIINNAVQRVENALQELLDAHNSYKRELEEKKDEHLQALSTHKDNHAQALESEKTTHLASLETAKNTHLTTLETSKDAHLASLSSHKTTIESELTTHGQGLSQTMESIKDSYLAEIRNDIPAQVAGLTQLCEEIKASNQALGSNFQQRIYTTGGNFSVINGVSQYYVFMRGGTGGTNNSNRGGNTSLGSILTATGGAGNPNGAGQLGESRAGFFTITANQAMTVPSGGIIIISWATR